MRVYAGCFIAQPSPQELGEFEAAEARPLRTRFRYANGPTSLEPAKVMTRDITG